MSRACSFALAFNYNTLNYLRLIITRTVLTSLFDCNYIILGCIITSFTSLALEGVCRRLGLYKVLTPGQGNLEAKGEPRTTNTRQIMYRKTYSKGGLEPQATQRPARHHTWWSSLKRPPKGQIL